MCKQYDDYVDDLQFCKDNGVTYPACVPREQELWPNHTVWRKDQWVAQRVQRYMNERMELETNEELMDLGVNEKDASDSRRDSQQAESSKETAKQKV